MRGTMRITLGSSANFLRRQILYIAVSAVAGAIFWAIGERINPFTVLLYGLAIGNLTVSATERLHGLYAQRRFPYNWLLFLCLLFVLLIPIYLTSSVFVWLLAPPTPQTLSGTCSERVGSFRYSSRLFPVCWFFCTRRQKKNLNGAMPNFSNLWIWVQHNLKCRIRSCSAPGRYNSRCFPRRFRSCLDSRLRERGARRGW